MATIPAEAWELPWRILCESLSDNGARAKSRRDQGRALILRTNSQDIRKKKRKKGPHLTPYIALADESCRLCLIRLSVSI